MIPRVNNVEYADRRIAAKQWYSLYDRSFWGGFGQEFFFVSVSVCHSRSNSFVRAPSSGGGSNAPRPAVSVPHLAGIGYVSWARQARSKCANFCILGSTRPSYSWILAYICRAWTKQTYQVRENIYFQVGIISKLASYFVPTTLFFMVTPRSVWPVVHIVRLTAVSLLFDIGFLGSTPLFERSLSSRGATPYPTTSLHPVSVPILHPRAIQLTILWSQTVRLSKPNNRN